MSDVDDLKDFPLGSEERPLLCFSCIWAENEWGKCVAFGNRPIPAEILRGEFIHNKPYPPSIDYPFGDFGLQYRSEAGTETLDVQHTMSLSEIIETWTPEMLATWNREFGEEGVVDLDDITLE